VSRRLLSSILALVGLAAAACGSSGGTGESGPGNAQAASLRLGYFPNVTHATAIAGVDRGIFARALEPSRLKTTTFNAGPAAIESLLTGALDATYIGPNPALNAHAKSNGKAVRVVSGATSGGAALVVHPSVGSAEDLKGKKVASPQLGGSQDVALRFWLEEKGLSTNLVGGGDVSIAPQENAQTLETFRMGQIAGAWVPEPWSTRLVQEAGGKVLVDERDLWPGRQFVTTLLLVRTELLDENPDVVRRLLEGHVEANRFVNEQPKEAQAAVNRGIGAVTGKPLPEATVQAAWQSMTFTNDPIVHSFRTSAAHAEAVGLLERVEVGPIFDLRLLNEVLRSHGQREVST
jgi:NitT/TauT family transport system substrate-binding protein